MIILYFQVLPPQIEASSQTWWWRSSLKFSPGKLRADQFPAVFAKEDEHLRGLRVSSQTDHQTSVSVVQDSCLVDGFSWSPRGFRGQKLPAISSDSTDLRCEAFPPTKKQRILRVWRVHSHYINWNLQMLRMTENSWSSRKNLSKTFKTLTGYGLNWVFTNSSILHIQVFHCKIFQDSSSSVNSSRLGLAHSPFRSIGSWQIHIQLPAVAPYRRLNGFWGCPQ